MKNVMKMTKEDATEVAKDFLSTYNPDAWDGKGEMPDSFDNIHYEKYYFYDKDNDFENELDLMYVDNEDTYVLNLDLNDLDNHSIDELNSIDDLVEAICDILNIKNSKANKVK